jgi:hypothetical protein
VANLQCGMTGAWSGQCTVRHDRCLEWPVALESALPGVHVDWLCRVPTGPEKKMFKIN